MFFFLLLATILLWGMAPIIEKKGIANADPFSSTYPLVTLILSALILKEGITPIRILGTIMIIGGIWFIK